MGRVGGSARDTRPKIPRVVAALSVAGVDAVAEEIDRLRLGHHEKCTFCPVHPDA